MDFIVVSFIAFDLAPTLFTLNCWSSPSASRKSNQKFNVSGKSAIASHQYQQNIMAAQSQGTDLKKYMVLRKGRFAFNPMHVGRDEKLPIAVYRKDEPALVSPAYSMFEISSDKINLDYLMLLL